MSPESQNHNLYPTATFSSSRVTFLWLWYKSLTVFLPALAASLESGREADALAAWRDYVKDYLTAINETNDLL
jgi:hypothetical protein